MVVFVSMFGMWDALTVMMVIGGLKPAQCLINLLSIGLQGRRHKELMFQLVRTDKLLRENLGIRVRAAPYVRRVMIITAGACLVALAFRVVEHRVNNEQFGQEITSDISFIAVIVLNGWLILPLLYFHLLTKIIRLWLEAFKDVARKNTRTSRPCMDQGPGDVQSLFDCYTAISRTVKKVDDLFNCFILLSAARCILVAVLFFYFCMESSTNFPLTRTRYPDPGELTSIYLSMGWTLVEVIAAVAFLAVFSWAAAETNRTVRCIRLLALLGFDFGEHLTTDQTRLRTWDVSVPQCSPSCAES